MLSHIKCIKDFYVTDAAKFIFKLNNIYAVKYTASIDLNIPEQEIGIIGEDKRIWWFIMPTFKGNGEYYRKADYYFNIEQYLKLKIFT